MRQDCRRDRSHDHCCNVGGLLAGGSQKDCKSLLLSLNKNFPTNDLGEYTWYDGCGIERNAELGTIKLSQEPHVKT